MVKEKHSIDKRKYAFFRYSKKYPSMFLKEKRKIKKLLGRPLKIEHVGSTSIPGLGGKCIIDIAIKTQRNKLNHFLNKLKRIRYECNLEHPENEKRIFLKKIIRYRGKERRIHIHLVLNNDFWNSFIVFRDYLRIHDKERERYAHVKKEAVKHAKGEGKKYREYKDEFLRDLMKKAYKAQSV